MIQLGREMMVRGRSAAFAPGLVVRSMEASPLSLSFRVANDAHIRRAYGAAVADEVVAELSHRLFNILPANCRIINDGNGVFVAHLHGDDLPGGEVAGAVLPVWLAAYCAGVLVDPVDTQAGSLCVWLSADWAFEGREGEKVFPFQGGPVGEGKEWEGFYRSDMARAVEFLPLLSQPRGNLHSGLVLYWQPVVGGQGDVLYHEALCRPCGADGRVQSPEPLLLALERLGFACLLDRHVVSAVVDELEAAPGVVLAANVSAQSLSCTHLWNEVIERLEQRPDIARRLVWEITETALVTDMNRAVAFIARVRALGCRIAIDDFGVGFASIRQLLVFSPDIIKIDRLFIDRAVLGPRDAAIFRQLVELARSFGAEVVAEGIETRAQAKIVEAAGSVWQQGYLHAMPSLTRLWWQGWGGAERLEPPR
ncbi:EAL domain-containing protein [Sphingomonas sp. NCPPB 2930]|uniref:EAL domain-containing protein n=1 Tax=Sphingomonas sp. NCPPB 2930 TaxID=3162788 RepID=UPI0036DAECF7